MLTDYSRIALAQLWRYYATINHPDVERILERIVAAHQARCVWERLHQTAALLQSCPQCQQPMSNLTGVYVLRKRGQTLEVCALCKDALMSEGWYLVAQQR